MLQEHTHKWSPTNFFWVTTHILAKNWHIWQSNGNDPNELAKLPRRPQPPRESNCRKRARPSVATLAGFIALPSPVTSGMPPQLHSHPHRPSSGLTPPFPASIGPRCHSTPPERVEGSTRAVGKIPRRRSPNSIHSHPVRVMGSELHGESQGTAATAGSELGGGVELGGGARRCRARRRRG